MWFQHFGQSILSWQTDFIRIHEASPWLCKQTSNSSLIPIANDSVKLDVELLEMDSSIQVKEQIVGKALNYELLVIPSIPTLREELVKCNHFESYVYALFNFAPDLIILITSSDAHTPPSMTQRKLHLMEAFGIKTNLEKTFRHSWLAIIDSGNLEVELQAENQKLISNYSFGKHTVEIMSQGWNCTPIKNTPVSVKIDSIEYAVSKRGLNFVIWAKKAEAVIDSVCFDTWSIVTCAQRIDLNTMSK
jgi:hypothetical protein